MRDLGATFHRHPAGSTLAGFLLSPVALRSSFRTRDAPQFGDPARGFRVASVPEPSTYALLLMTGAGALWLLRRRR